MADLLKLLNRRIVLLVVVLLGLTAVLTVAIPQQETRTVTAHFPRAVSVYEGTDVRILGVGVGEVTAVIPEGNSVRVEMEYDAEYDVPADAKAVIVTPTLVADRFVQLTPVYTEGPVMADGADIPLPETAVPVELDRIYASLRTLTRALGPNGVNADGTLDNLLRAGRKALDGQGARGNEMIRELSLAAKTFGEGAGPLFDTVSNLATFTETLAENDQLVRAFIKDLAGVSRVLADESEELDAAVASVARAVGTVEGFVRDNREALVRDVEAMTSVVSAIDSERENLDTALRIAPVALGNLHLGFDWQSEAQNARVGVGGNVWTADALPCAIVQQAPNMPRALKDAACALLRQLIRPLTTKLPYIPPEYESYIPDQFKQSGTEKRGTQPRVRPVQYSAGDDPSLTGLLGGAS